MRAHSDLPNLFFITDRRAISRNKTGPLPDELTAEDREISKALELIQKCLQETLKRKYGYGEAVFNGLARQAHRMPIVSNYIADYGGHGGGR